MISRGSRYFVVVSWVVPNLNLFIIFFLRNGLGHYLYIAWVIHSLRRLRILPMTLRQFSQHPVTLKYVGILHHCEQSLLHHIQELAVSPMCTCLSPVSSWVTSVALTQGWENHNVRDILLSWECVYTPFTRNHVSEAKEQVVRIVTW